MATALKDIQFSSPVLNGTTANSKTTWTYGANDVVVFGCGSDGCDYSERHWGLEIHDGSEYHCGEEHHDGCEYHCGSVTFSSCGYEYHNGDEYHCGYEGHDGYESHNGYESHHGCEYHEGYETHCGSEQHYGYEEHYGWVYFGGSCSCASDGFTGTNICVSGIAVVDTTDPSNKVLLTYSELKSHGF
jgi:hypothetical protein